MGFDYELFLKRLRQLGVIESDEEIEFLLQDYDTSSIKYCKLLVELFDKYRESKEELSKAVSYLNSSLEIVEFYGDIAKNYNLVQVSKDPEANGIWHCPDEGSKAREFLKEYKASRESDKESSRESKESYLRNSDFIKVYQTDKSYVDGLTN